MHHDDKFGELVPSEEREWLCNQVYDAMIMQVIWCSGFIELLYTVLYASSLDAP